MPPEILTFTLNGAPLRAHLSHSSYGASLEQRAANARLIASAPDLLEELETAVARVALANSEGNPILSAWLPGARAAVARAKGTQ